MQGVALGIEDAASGKAWCYGCAGGLGAVEDIAVGTSDISGQGLAVCGSQWHPRGILPGQHAHGQGYGDVPGALGGDRDGGPCAAVGTRHFPAAVGVLCNVCPGGGHHREAVAAIIEDGAQRRPGGVANGSDCRCIGIRIDGGHGNLGVAVQCHTLACGCIHAGQRTPSAGKYGARNAGGAQNFAGGVGRAQVVALDDLQGLSLAFVLWIFDKHSHGM